jgi:hypothetical protein
MLDGLSVFGLYWFGVHVGVMTYSVAAIAVIAAVVFLLAALYSLFKKR